ncbi:serine/threonine protein kinase [Minicystis rosea]|nr:serine/threonine protein kinase [Minicystis rosea]
MCGSTIMPSACLRTTTRVSLPRVGSRFGRYETLQPIASGGMATVHLARAVGAGGFERLVAIKVMHPGMSDDPDFSAMFLDEARVAARIRHPNVVGTVDVQDGPEGLFLVMEYVEGPSLFAITRAASKRGQRVPIGVALRIVIDALLGLHAAHEQTGPAGEPLNIVHRDVSPQNILVSVDGQAKITDFGVARAEARLSSTRRGEVKGKLAYMPPQQVRAEPLDRRADVYGAGVVLWELLAGERLFRADNDGALVVAVMTGAQRSPRDVNPSVAAALDRECMRALRVDPAERHPTALAFAEALEVAAEEAGITLATPRVLAGYVKELGAHKPIEVPPMEVIPGEGSGRSRPGSSARLPAPDASGGLAAAPAASAAPAIAAHAQAPAADGNSQVASVLSAPSAALAPQRSPARIGAMIAVLVAVAGAAVMGTRLLGGTASAPAPAASAASAASTLPSASASATAAPAVTTVVTAASSAEPTAAPSASARPNATPPANGRPPASTGPKRPRGGGTDWKPEGL